MGSGPFDQNALNKGGLGNYRVKFPGVPDREDAETALSGRALLEAIGAMSDPTGMVPNVPRDQYAPPEAPDLARLKTLNDQSALAHGLSAIRAAPSRGNIEPKALGDNVFTAYLKHKNAGEQARMKEDSAYKQQRNDLYNKALQLRQGQTKELAEIAASSDQKQAGLERSNKAGIAALGAGSRERAEKIRALAKVKAAGLMQGGGSRSQAAYLNLKMRNKTAETEEKDFIDKLGSVLQAVSDGEKWMANPPTSQKILDTAQGAAAGIPFVGSKLSKAVGEYASAPYENAEWHQTLKGLTDTIIRIDQGTGKPRITDAQKRLVEDYNLVNPKDTPDVKARKLQNLKKWANETLERLSDLRTFRGHLMEEIDGRLNPTGADTSDFEAELEKAVPGMTTTEKPNPVDKAPALPNKVELKEPSKEALEKGSEPPKKKKKLKYNPATGDMDEVK